MGVGYWSGGGWGLDIYRHLAQSTESNCRKSKNLARAPSIMSASPKKPSPKSVKKARFAKDDESMSSEHEQNELSAGPSEDKIDRLEKLMLEVVASNKRIEGRISRIENTHVTSEDIKTMRDEIEGNVDAKFQKVGEELHKKMKEHITKVEKEVQHIKELGMAFPQTQWPNPSQSKTGIPHRPSSTSSVGGGGGSASKTNTNKIYIGGLGVDKPKAFLASHWERVRERHPEECEGATARPYVGGGRGYEVHCSSAKQCGDIRGAIEQAGAHHWYGKDGDKLFDVYTKDVRTGDSKTLAGMFGIVWQSIRRQCEGSRQLPGYKMWNDYGRRRITLQDEFQMVVLCSIGDDGMTTFNDATMQMIGVGRDKIDEVQKGMKAVWDKQPKRADE